MHLEKLPVPFLLASVLVVTYAFSAGAQDLDCLLEPNMVVSVTTEVEGVVKKVLVDRGLVLEYEFFVCAMRHTHDIHVPELGATLAPVAMSEDMVTSHLATCFDDPL